MSRKVIAYSSLIGGSLRATENTAKGAGKQFVVESEPYGPAHLTLFLNREEAAQWAAVLTEYAEADQ